MTIPDPIVDFLGRATTAVTGTRDVHLVPHVQRPSGWSVEADRRTMLCLFPEAFRDELERSLAGNGEIALTVSETPSHESYQFKGKCLSTGPVGEGDLEIYRTWVDRAVGHLGRLFGYSERDLRANAPPPVLRVRFEVREIFDQTPGPGAGRRLVPPEER